MCAVGAGERSTFSHRGRLKENVKVRVRRGGMGGVGYLAARAAETWRASTTFSEFYLRFIKSQPSTLLTFTEQEATPAPLP